MEFTPKQLHYFKRELITDQLNREISLLIHNPDTVLDDKDNNSPLLSYVFHNIITQFPLLKQTTQDEFWQKCKILLNEFNKAQLDNFYSPQHAESSLQRKHIQRKLKKSLVFAYCASIKTANGQEESIKISESLPSVATTKQPWINIVTVRQVKEKRRLREVTHAEFVIETRLDDDKVVHVAKRYRDFRRLRNELKHHYPHLPTVPHKYQSQKQERFYREQDRLSLRGFLHHLLDHVGKNAILHSFLTKDPISFVPQEDCWAREEADAERAKEQDLCQQEVDNRVKDMHATLEELKKEMIRPGGLIEMFGIIKQTKDIQDLPSSLKRAFEWGRLNFAFALHKQFVTLDTANENLNQLRRTHTQPFGSKSLFQRILISNMNEESKSLQKSIERLKEKVSNEKVSEKVLNAIYTPKQSNWKAEMVALLENEEIEPILSPKELSELLDEDKLKNIYQLWDLYGRVREQEVMMELVFQGVTGELLREFIAVFYQPLAQVYRAADISTSIRHVAAFIDDLLNTIEQDDSIQSFINLIMRHEQNFYDFVYKVHTQEASHVFDELIRYVDKLFTFMTQGIPGQVDMNQCVDQAGIQSEELKGQLLAEIDSLCEYRYKQKMYRFERTRNKLMAHSGLVPNEQDEQIIEGFEELQEESDDYYSTDDSSEPSSSLHTNTSNNSSNADIDPPLLILIPKITKYFIGHVVQLMNTLPTTST
ncbi:hypothetical protein RO3G_00958 [Rhizopus delemar RA 99-880]|uniref:PX domain-containing protein n=1 Tax=Rhizopus delemar (strain RA 99-880 / ATCC MYA-4621 / FGSC 9543 / NRRL 43880) TaxID=246409 RepID=I1BJ74_RHIO9|nr:hypothetical protein RO3G_00958 [Rhizopus delemar RA 99-880]|eukprot:EIE76254.1 hypothetical protein RO3G_00958 [Rhizopus delemar RA 99-880]